MSDAVDTLERPPGFHPRRKAPNIVSPTADQPAVGPSSIKPETVDKFPDEHDLTTPLGQQSRSKKKGLADQLQERHRIPPSLPGL
jgi:hypothetical protein